MKETTLLFRLVEATKRPRAAVGGYVDAVPVVASPHGSRGASLARRAVRVASVAFLIGGTALGTQAHALSFGGDKDVSVKVTRGGVVKGKSTIALGAFRVAFVTDDAANGKAMGIFGTAAKMGGQLIGVDQPLMQKIADAVYAEFLRQAAAKGYAVIDSVALANAAAAYAALTPSENFATGRLGTYVIPTGQRSVGLAADTRDKGEKGAGGFATRFNIINDQLAKAPAYEAFPTAASQVGVPVLAITIVVNFANFKGSGSYGNSNASLALGATIDGRNKNELAPSTSILAWDRNTETCTFCQAQYGLEGQIHSDAFIGTIDSVGTKSDKTAFITIDPAAYEQNVLLVTTQAVDLLLSALVAER